jgi:hypothetical protein
LYTGVAAFTLHPYAHPSSVVPLVTIYYLIIKLLLQTAQWLEYFLTQYFVDHFVIILRWLVVVFSVSLVDAQRFALQFKYLFKKKLNSAAFSRLANYTDRATAACRGS